MEISFNNQNKARSNGIRALWHRVKEKQIHTRQKECNSMISKDPIGREPSFEEIADAFEKLLPELQAGTPITYVSAHRILKNETPRRTFWFINLMVGYQLLYAQKTGYFVLGENAGSLDTMRKIYQKHREINTRSRENKKARIKII